MPPYTKKEKNGFSVTSYAGDGAVLLAFNMDEDKIDNLAGFAIYAVTPDKGPYPTNEYWLKNRLGFDADPDNPAAEQSIDSNKAPFQTFHWVHFPGAGPGKYTYTVHPCYFKSDGSLDVREGVSVNVDLGYHSFKDVEVGFTRGYISSQAYMDWCAKEKKDIYIGPSEKSFDFDTDAYEDKYTWLGAHARKLLFNFLDECAEDETVTLDAFTYDFNEPKMIKKLAAMGSRVRLYQDDASLHTKDSALEPKAIQFLADNQVAVKTGHFGNFSHDKVLIKKKDGKAVKVLTGSANFSLRGLYVQSNSMLVFDDPSIADLYEQAFEQAFTDPKDFRKANIAKSWFDMATNDSSVASFSFAPHSEAFPLDTLADSINKANSSVFFMVMEAGGSGPVMPALASLEGKAGLYSLGVIEQKGQVEVFKKDNAKNTSVVSFSFLKKNVPKPFKPEWSGGQGQVIHHKFVVCDFNTPDAVVYCGSSNLAKGGETKNGDNLIAIHDPNIAVYYAIEAIRSYDHYRFRCAQENNETSSPLTLAKTDKWTKRYYEQDNLKFQERMLYSGQ